MAPTRRRLVRLALGLAALALLVYGGWRGFLHYLYAQIKPAALAPAPAVRGLPAPHASACAGCHPEIAREWRESLHARAMTDRFFVAEYEEQKRIFACLRCHAPLHAQQPTLVTGLARIAPARARETPNAAFDAELQREGVTCLVCHQRGDALAGPLPFEASLTPHAVVVDPAFADNGLCVRCHAAESFPFSKTQRSVLPTFEEHAAYREKGGDQSCVTCHFSPIIRSMAPGAPARLGRRHTLLGARDRDFLRAHLEVSPPTCAREGERVACAVQLTNRAGHRYPTGEPGREIAVELVPAAGEPARASIVRRMDRIDLVEAPGDDNTLLPHETREVRLAAQAPASLLVRFCLFEAREPILAQTRTPYDAVCQTLAVFTVDAAGGVTRGELPDDGLRARDPALP